MILINPAHAQRAACLDAAPFTVFQTTMKSCTLTYIFSCR